MSNVAHQYEQLVKKFDEVEREMRDAPRDGLQGDLREAARAIARFEIKHEIPKLKTLVAAHAAALSAIEAAKGKLAQLERSIASQEVYIENRFPTADTTGDVIDLLGWREAVKFGERAISRLDTIAAEVEVELKDFVRDHRGVSDCLQISGWNQLTRDSYAYLFRETPEIAQEAA